MGKTKRILRRQPNVAKSQSSSNPNSNRLKKDFETESLGKENKIPTIRRSPPPAPAKKFIPTIPEPFEMTIREENKRKEKLLSVQTGLIENLNKPESKSNKHND